MAYTSTHGADVSAVPGAFSRFFNAVLNGMTSIAENHPKMRQAAALQAMSDEELAKRGLKRDDIVKKVFANSFHI
ncbi:MAG: DUF1127 domain-containing protein [Heliomarina sp.]|uniref:DUF1127 domain-containing protein n=1 Tax=Heliomarina sp. TaxID=2917556 RepID=UPI0040586306